MRVFHVVGARPNFMKLAPVFAALRKCPRVHQVIVHTGQHYDLNMSDVFFQQLGMPEVDINLNVGSGSHTAQTAQIMQRLEPVLLDQKPDLVFVYGDVNSTVAAALVCAKLLIPLAHVEAGLRSFDRTMPEEINRLLTDQVADFLFTHCTDANENLKREGISSEKIHFVGNVMIDTLVRFLPCAHVRWDALRKAFGVDRYVLVTLHRPSNVDAPEILANLLTTLDELSKDVTVIFPVHLRTRKRIREYQRDLPSGPFFMCEPMSYLEFLSLEAHASIVITDSGGIQEETTFLGIPCLTVRKNTERPVTVNIGTNTLVGRDMEKVLLEARTILNGGGKKGGIPPLWDGHAAERIARIVV